MVSSRGDEDHRQVGELGDVAHQLDAGGARQHQVEQDQIRRLGADDARELRGLARHQCDVSRPGKRGAREAQRLRVVVDHQDAGGLARTQAGRARTGGRALSGLFGHRDGEGEARALAGAAALGADAPAVRLHQSLADDEPEARARDRPLAGAPVLAEQAGWNFRLSMTIRPPPSVIPPTLTRSPCQTPPPRTGPNRLRKANAMAERQA